MDKLDNDLAGVREALLFEDLLAELSATFIRITTDRIDGEIERWLRHVVLALGFDRGTVGQIKASDGILYATHQWAREGVNPTPEQLNVATILPWLTGKILANETVVLPRVEELPPGAAKDLEYARLVGCRSNVTVPLKIGGVVVGAVAFDAVLNERTCSNRELQRLRLVVEVFGNALERKRADEDIARMREEMRQVSRVAMMGELTVSLAHELNQPLGAILNNAQAARRMLQTDQPNFEDLGAALEDIVRDDSRAVDIVAQVRALFQRGETHKAQIDLKQTVSDIERIIRHDAMRKGISLRLEVPDSLPTVVGQRTQLMQVLLNLILNAFDAVCENDGGKREVEVRAHCREEGRVHVVVRDSGKGIDPRNMPRLFHAFFTTKAKGIGLGLAIARSIVESHGGRLWAAQNPDQGATLEFELPAGDHVPTAS